MKKRIVLPFFVIMLMITSVLVSSAGITISNISNFVKLSDENDAELPEWIVDDSWSYSMDMTGGYGDNYISLTVSDLTYTVTEVQTDFYKLDMSGVFTGYVSLDVIPLSGNLKNGQITGTAYANKSTLAIESIEGFEIEFGIGISTYTMEGTILITYGNSLLKFPLNIGDSWLVDDILIDPQLTFKGAILNIDIKDLIKTLSNTDYIFLWAYYANCEKWDLVESFGKDYDALKLFTYAAEDQHNVWYAPSVGNIVKVETRGMHFGGTPEGYFGKYDLDVLLKSTTYDIRTASPDIPTDLGGDVELLIGRDGTYYASSTDPDNDMIRYIFDFGDGTIAGTETFYPSGTLVSITHTWDKGGEFNVKVKARDKSGAESAWSDPITVNVINNPPEIPDIPDGPATGQIRERSGPYTTSTTEPDGHEIYYQFDWDDGSMSSWIGPKNSGEPASASHTWRRRGGYGVRARAKDEYGATSDWSPPLEVSMPKAKSYTLLNNLFTRLSKILQYPIFEKLLN
jgi:hypothetical protein